MSQITNALKIRSGYPAEIVLELKNPATNAPITYLNEFTARVQIRDGFVHDNGALITDIRSTVANARDEQITIDDAGGKLRIPLAAATVAQMLPDRNYYLEAQLIDSSSRPNEIGQYLIEILPTVIANE
ncbi:MAG: hypothetical protein M3209_00345 [Acidobacteriota bacterium]|nr:hypothetical protein [Acidobacteriota bacterium]